VEGVYIDPRDKELRKTYGGTFIATDGKYLLRFDR
jgi:hypothetical protein